MEKIFITNVLCSKKGYRAVNQEFVEALMKKQVKQNTAFFWSQVEKLFNNDRTQS